jgi:hypothetical protein
VSIEVQRYITRELTETNNTRSSQANVERMLTAFFDEIRSGKRDGSTVSSVTSGSLSMTEQETWRQIWRELQSVGITPELFSQHIGFIKTTIATAVDEGATGDLFYELQEDLNRENLSASSGSMEVLTSPSLIALSDSGRYAAGDDVGHRVHKSIRQVPLAGKADLASRRKRPSVISRMLYRVSHDKSDLRLAIENDRSFLAQALVEKGADVEGGLSWAAEFQSIASLRRLLPFFKKDHDEVLAAFTIAQNIPDLDMARIILEYMNDQGKELAMLHAAVHGDPSIVPIFLEFDMDLNAPVNGATILILSARYGQMKLTKALLEHGADINVQGIRPDHRTALQATIYSNSIAKPSRKLEMVELLVSRGADIHGGDGLPTPLSVAQTLGERDIAKLLKRAGATH